MNLRAADMDHGATDYNAEYFPDPEEFKPSRWYDVRENDLSMFSFGSRTCKY